MSLRFHLRFRLLMLSVVVAAPLTAQTATNNQAATDTPTDASFVGTVTLIDGTPAAGATIEAAQPDEPPIAAAQSDEEGRYAVTDLPPGEYVLSFTFPGMAPQQITAVAVAGQDVEVNANLELGQAADTIVVTSNRREQDLLDVPMSIAALPQSTIDRMGIQSVGDVARAVPGLEVVEQAPGVNRLFLRGVTNGNSLTSLVGVYLDEIPVTATSLTQLDLRLVDLERVEVLRGPQGTLYGQGSAGGTIRYITQDPLLDSFHGNVSLNTYTTENGDMTEELTGAINLPLVENAFGLRLSGTVGDFGGWIDQPAAGREDINNQNLTNLNLKALWTPGERFSLRTTALVHRNDGDGITNGADEDYNVAYPNGDPLAQQSFDNEYEIYNITAKYEFDRVQLTSSTSSVHTNAAHAGIAFKLARSIGAPIEQFIADDLDTESTSQELRLSSRGDGRFNWVVGTFYADSTLERDLRLDAYFAGTFLGQNQILAEVDSKTWSVYGDASYAVTDRLDLGTGVRTFRDRRSTPSGDEILRETFDSVDPRFYLTYRLTDNTNIYANVAKGFRSGGFGGDLDGSTFDPETVWSYELGTKGASKRFRWELAGYTSDYEDYQAFVLQTDVFGFLTNAGDAEIKGVEASLAYYPTPRWTLQVSGNVNDAELATVAAGATSNMAGDRLDLVTDYTVAVATEYAFDWTPSKPGFLRVDYNQIGPSTATERSLNIIEASSDTIRLLSARLGVALEAFSVELFGQNFLGEDGLQDPFAILGWDSRPRPRTLGLKFGYQF